MCIGNKGDCSEVVAKSEHFRCQVAVVTKLRALAPKMELVSCYRLTPKIFMRPPILRKFVHHWMILL